MLASPLAIPEFVLRSPLVAVHRGFVVTDAIPDVATLDAMRQEAWAAYATADRQECDTSDEEDGRGGMPRRRLFSAGAGPAQDAFYHDPALSEQLSGVCGMRVRPSGSRGSYSYYASEGDFLDLHRDVETCDVTLITVLHDTTDTTSGSGALVLYPDRLDEPLSEIRATPDDGAAPLKLMPGQSIILLGGVVPHYVAPVEAGQARVISALCFLAETDCVPCRATAPVRR
jgi:hypothetical protein